MLAVVGPHPERSRVVAVDSRRTEIGRDAACDLVLESARVSRRHAVVRVRDGEYVIEDLASRNGTLLNGELVTRMRHLRDGDLLTFADVDVEFQLAGIRTPPRYSLPSQDEDWEPAFPTEPFEKQPVRAEPHPSHSMREDLHQARGFSVWALLLAIAGSVVGAVFTSALGTGEWVVLAGAALGPAVSTTFSTRHTGEKGRVRTAAIVIMSISALLITVTGFSFADRIAGRSVLPGADGRTFPIPMVEPSDPITEPSNATTGPGIEVEPAGPIECDEVPVGSKAFCTSVTIRSTGDSELSITSVEVTGKDKEEFIAGAECVNASIEPEATPCEMTVLFRPQSAGERTATLVIHQNLPSPDTGTKVQLIGLGADGSTGAGFTLDVKLDDQTGSGISVRSDPEAIDCPGVCSATFAMGATVTLIADLDASTGVVDWEGCQRVDDKTCWVLVDRDRIVDAQLVAPG